MINDRDKYPHKTIIFLLIMILVFSVGLFATIGTANVSILDTFRIIGSKFPILNRYVESSHILDSYKTIIWSIRLPRCYWEFSWRQLLSAAGAAFQGMFRNPMADPICIREYLLEQH